MTLEGTLKDGAKVERIPYCEFQGLPANSLNDCACDDDARYRVTFPTGEVLHACEEHAQRLWDQDEACKRLGEGQ